MNVLVVHSFWHERGGDSTAVDATVAGLEARGHRVLPFAMRHPDNRPSPWEARWPAWREADRLVSVPGGIWSRSAARALDSVLVDARVDVAHLHHVHRHLTPSVLGPLRARGIRVVWTLHDYELVCPSGLLYVEGARCTRCFGHHYQEAVRHRCKKGDPTRSAAVAVEKAVHALLGVAGWVDAFVCPSRFLLERVAEAGLPRARLHHLPNLLPPLPLAEGPGEGWVYAGRLAEEKGVEDLLDAARSRPGLPGTVIGDGPDAARLRRLAPAHVRFTGALPRAETLRRLGGAAIVVVPSRWPENDPYAVTEAQAMGRVVVACAVGGIPEQVTDGIDGLLVPPRHPAALGAALDRLDLDPPERARLGAAARARVRAGRNPEAHLERLVGIYGG